MPEFIASLVIAAPLTAFAIIAVGMLLGRLDSEAGEPFAGWLSTGATLVSLLGAIALLLLNLFAVDPGPRTLTLFNWFASGRLEVTVTLSTDPLSLWIGCLFALLLFLTQRYSVYYLHRERGFFRFFMILNLFATAMLLIVYSGNAITAFLGWEMAGLSSYLLIAYAWNRPVASANSARVFITNRLGDAGFLLALVLAFYWAGSGDWSHTNAVLLQHDSLQRFLVLSGFTLAALVKSAQFPFSAWITRALEGPTPSSAIFYGSLMIHAGIFLLLRISPLIDASEAMQVVLIAIGLLTVGYGWLGGLVQTDIKSALIFSALTQTGLMLVSIGLGWYTLAAWHLAAHAAWRALQMLASPSYLTLVHRQPRPVHSWLRSQPRLFNAALNRLWLDNVIDWIAVRPALLLARDLNHFDDNVVNRMVGLPGQVDAISSLTDYEERKRGLVNPEAGMTRGSGIMGRLMEKVANGMHWFEESLVLKGSGDGLVRGLQRIGAYLVRIDYLFSRPRYLWLIILLTMLVVL